jgi:hypothetical protein
MKLHWIGSGQRQAKIGLVTKQGKRSGRRTIIRPDSNSTCPHGLYKWIYPSSELYQFFIWL